MIINEYFLAASDAAAAAVLEDGPADGVIGPEPNTELVCLEALLLGLDPDSEQALDLVSRPHHAADIAHDDTYDRVVVKIAAATTQLIGGATLDELRAQFPRWVQTDELAGVDLADLDAMFTRLRPLFTAAAGLQGQLYVWISL
jgi:hypothetical protein